METLIVLAILVALIAMGRKAIGPKKELNTVAKRPSDEFLPKREVPNDKLVLIEKITVTDIDRVLKDFCGLYNETAYQALPRLHKISETRYAVTFPYDIAFPIFCFFVDHANYPIDFEEAYDAIGWTTTKREETWITDKSANKRVMLFVSPDEKAGGSIYLTTEDNIGYKLNFGSENGAQLLDTPDKHFVKSPIDITKLGEGGYIDYK